MVSIFSVVDCCVGKGRADDGGSSVEGEAVGLSCVAEDSPAVEMEVSVVSGFSEVDEGEPEVVGSVAGVLGFSEVVVVVCTFVEVELSGVIGLVDIVETLTAVVEYDSVVGFPADVEDDDSVDVEGVVSGVV